MRSTRRGGRDHGSLGHAVRAKKPGLENREAGLVGRSAFAVTGEHVAAVSGCFGG